LFVSLPSSAIQIAMLTCQCGDPQVMLVRRDTGEKTTYPEDGLTGTIKTLLDTIQADMFAKAKKQCVVSSPEAAKRSLTLPKLTYLCGLLSDTTTRAFSLTIGRKWRQT
jgi:hypothetical protein